MKAYFINLARRTDRRDQMQSRFDKIGLSWERIEAVTPDDISADQLARYCNPAAYKWQTQGELACSLSHVRALQRFLETDAPYGAIFEDDAVLSPSLRTFLDLFSETAPDVDLLRLETEHVRLRMVKTPDQTINAVGLFRMYSTGGGAAGYVVSRRGAERIVAGEEILFDLTDQALFNPYARLAKDLVMRQTDPALVVQENRYSDPGDRTVGSDLNALRVARSRRDMSNMLSRVHYNIWDFFDRDIRLAAIKAWHEYVGGAARRTVPFKSD